MAVWNETPEGANVQQAFQRVQYTYTVTLPNHLASLQALASRPITG